MSRFNRPVVSMMPELNIDFYAGTLNKAQQDLERATSIQAAFEEKIGNNTFHSQEDIDLTVGRVEEGFKDLLSSDFVSPSKVGKRAIELQREIAPYLQATQAKDAEVQRQRRMQDQWGMDWMGTDVASTSITDSNGRPVDPGSIRGININRAQLRQSWAQGRGAQYLQDRPAGWGVVPGSDGTREGLRSTKGISDSERQQFTPGTASAREHAIDTFSNLPENVREDLIRLGGDENGALGLLESEIQSATNMSDFAWRENWSNVNKVDTSGETVLPPSNNDRGGFARNLTKESTPNSKAFLEEGRETQEAINTVTRVGESSQALESVLDNTKSLNPNREKKVREDREKNYFEEVTAEERERWQKGEATPGDALALLGANVSTVPEKVGRGLESLGISISDAVKNKLDRAKIFRNIHEIVTGNNPISGETTKELVKGEKDYTKRGELLEVIGEGDFSKYGIERDEDGIPTFITPDVGAGIYKSQNALRKNKDRAISRINSTIKEGIEGMNEKSIEAHKQISKYYEEHSGIIDSYFDTKMAELRESGEDTSNPTLVRELFTGAIQSMMDAQNNMRVAHHIDTPMISLAADRKTGEVDITKRRNEEKEFRDNLQTILRRHSVKAVEIEQRKKTEKERGRNKKEFRTAINEGISDAFLNPGSNSLLLTLNGEDSPRFEISLNDLVESLSPEMGSTVTGVKNFINSASQFKPAAITIDDREYTHVWRYSKEEGKMVPLIYINGHYHPEGEAELREDFASYFFNKIARL